MKNKHGNTVPNAHLVLLFQRICKLLYYGIKPIFVFDGGVPELKKKTMVIH
jgi:DNA excision repair protein ERCC-5